MLQQRIARQSLRHVLGAYHYKLLGTPPKQPISQQRSQYTDIKAQPSPLQELELPFAPAKLGTFFQEAPQLGNQYEEDKLLQTYLKRYMPKEVGLNFNKLLNLSSMYTHFNTLKKKALGKHCGKR